MCGCDYVIERLRQSVSWRDVTWPWTNFIQTTICKHHHRHHSIRLT